MYALLLPYFCSDVLVRLLVLSCLCGCFWWCSVALSYEMDATRELMGLGAANVVMSLVGTSPAMAGLGRSAVNASTGAKSQLSMLVPCCCFCCR